MRSFTFFLLGSLAFFSAFSTLGVGASALKKFKDLQIGEEILSNILERDRSRRLTADVLSGKTVLMLFATGEQQFSLNALQDINKVAESRLTKDLVTIAIISSRRGADEVQSLRKQYNVHYQIFHDEGDLLTTQLGIIVYPTTLIINKKGLLAYYYPLYGPDFLTEVSSHLDRIIADTDDRYLKEEIAKRKQIDGIKKAREEIEAGKVSEAVAILDSLLSEGPASFDLHVLLGFSLISMQSPQKALVHFKKAKELNSDSTIVDLGMGVAFSRSGKRDKAIEQLSEIINRDPTSYIAYRELARIHEETGEVDKAIYYITKELDSLTKHTND